MALSTEEKDALIELKQKGYSYSDAMGFIASSRLGNTSRVEKDLEQISEVTEPSDAVSDIKRGFAGAKEELESGIQREQAIAGSDRGFLSKQFGRVAGGLRTAGGMVGSIGTGVVRALPFGTQVSDAIEGAVSKGIQEVANNPAAQWTGEQFNRLPESVKRTAGDIGNIAMGGAELAGVLTAPGATKAFTTGLKEFANSGIKEFGQIGIQSSIKSGLSPEDLMQRVARVSKGKQTEFEKRAGQSIGGYLVDRGIFGDPDAITSQLYERMQMSKGRVDAGLAKVGGTYKDDAVLDALEQLAEREVRVSSPRTPSPDQRRVSELLSKHNKDGLTLTEVNEVKRLYERNVQLDYLKDNVSDKVAQAKNIDNKLRDFVETKADQGGFSTVKALNKETALAKQLLDDLGAEYAGQAGNNLVSLSDAFFLAEAAGNPAALAAFGLKKGLSSKAAMSAVAKIIAGKRQRKGLPSGDVEGPLGLPAVGATSAPPDAAIPLGARSPSTVAAQEASRVTAPSGTPTPTVAESALLNEKTALQRADAEVQTEMTDLSQAGSRVVLPPDATRSGPSVIGIPSTFPKWIPEQYRDSALFDRVLTHINNKTNPGSSAVRELELKAVVEKEIADRAKEYADNPTPENTFSMGDAAFAAALMAGGSYYLFNEDGSFLPVAVVGMMSPGAKKMAIKQLDEHIVSLEKRANNTKNKMELNRLQKAIEDAKKEQSRFSL